MTHRHRLAAPLTTLLLTSCYVPSMTGEFDREHPFDAAVRFMEPSLPDAAKARLLKRLPAGISDADYLSLMSALSNRCRTIGREIVCGYTRTFMIEDALFARVHVWTVGRVTYTFETRVRRTDAAKNTLRVCVTGLQEKLTDAGTFVRDQDAAVHTMCSKPA